MGSSDLGGAGDVEFWRAEAARWRSEAGCLMAGNVVLQARVGELEGQVGALAEKVPVLAKLAFGKSSEKKPAKQVPDVDDLGGGDPGGGDPAGDGQSERRGRGQRKGSRGHGRRDCSHLPGREEIHDVGEGERVCPCCGADCTPFGEETCEQIDWQVQLIRIVHRRPTYRRTCRCPVRGVLVAPPVPKAIGKGRFTSGFLARLLVEKFVLGRPVHRIVAALAHDGLDVAEGTLAGVFAACSDLLGPLGAAIGDRNAAAAHLHVDETSWQVFAAVEGKDSHRWWCWVFVGPGTTVFTIAPSRSTKVLAQQLGIDTGTGTLTLPGALPGGRQVLLFSDFYAVYQSMGQVDGVDTLWCWAHIRRYFIRAGDANPKLAAWTAGWIERIAALCAAHTAITTATAGSAGHTMATAQFSAALNTIDAHRKAQASHPELLHPAAAKVLATLDREWDGLARHRAYPELPLDNNTAERALRGPVAGPKNYYGSGSVVSAQLASRVFTITATAQRAGLNPLAYLTAYLQECARAGGRAPTGQALTRFLPWAASTDDLTTWAYNPHRRARNGPEPDTTEPGTGSDARPAGDQHNGPAPSQTCPTGTVRHEPDLEPTDDQRPGDLPADGTDGPLELPKPTTRTPASHPDRRELRMLTPPRCGAASRALGRSLHLATGRPRPAAHRLAANTGPRP
ncbi:MAG: IS66 family transposase [Pseudonocardiales bacterium]